MFELAEVEKLNEHDIMLAALDIFIGVSKKKIIIINLLVD